MSFATSDEPAAEWETPFPRSLEPASELGTVRFLTKTGDPRAVLNDRGDASLLVVGAAGLGSFTSLLLGSTADWLLHQPVAPVAVIREPARTRRVLCCVDGSEHAQRAVQAVASLPWMTSCHARILSVDDGRTDTDTAIHAAQSALTTAEVATSTLVLSGPPTRSILTHIDTDGEPLDLVVIGTRGLTTFRRLWVGSTAAAVARHCRTNVLVASVPRSSEDDDTGPA
jgi:nucleotide-binding universal stress UspA family protein